MARTATVVLALGVVAAGGNVASAACPEGTEAAGTACIRAARMARLPAGQYAMGEARQKVEVAAFELDDTEVTAEAYAACVAAGACTVPDTGPGCTYGKAPLSSHPVNCVDFDQAVAFCTWSKKRLPTEGEWEWAARGATAATRYPWGNAAPGNRSCWSGEGNDEPKGKRRRTCPSGSRPEGDSPQKVKDLAGNVWEWTSSCPEESCAQRVLRGGSFVDTDPAQVAATSRTWFDVSTRSFGIGFRCARTIQ